MSRVVNCDVHDHFEIACMRRSLINVELHSKQLLEGVALDVFARKGQEYLKIKTENLIQDIELTDIAFLRFKDDGKLIKVS